MSSYFIRLTLGLLVGLGLGSSVWAAPTIQSVEVTPSPLTVGQSFTVTVRASADVTQGTATVDFRPAAARLLRLTLVKQGTNWTATSVIPADLQLPAGAGALVKALMFDASRQSTEQAVNIPVSATAVSAVFAGGVLTITGNDLDNTLTVTRDFAGNLFVNGGAIPITGGVPTVANTTLVRMLGLRGNDVLTMNDQNSNGNLPPSNLVGGEGNDTLTGSRSVDDLDGGPGNDTLTGGDGDDRLNGGPGNDSLNGGRGMDLIFGGEGNDEIVWNPGESSDVIEGEAGVDTLIFRGSNVGENMEFSANGSRFRLFRDVANVTMDCAGLERVVFQAFGGADVITVGDLTGTQVTDIHVDLLASNSDAGDAAADSVIVNGTAGADAVAVSGSEEGLVVTGLAAKVTVSGGEPGVDNLIINTLGGADTVDASAVPAGLMTLTFNGGDGTDTLIGGHGDDVLNGGRGDDVLLGGDGQDTFVWNPGDNNDTIEGQGGQDTLRFNGANIAENINVSANGQRVRFTRNVANIVMDCDGVETVQFNALGGADIITVNDLAGTEVTQVNLDLGNPAGSGVGDGQADTVIVNGTANDDAVVVTGTSTVTVVGLQATVNIFGNEAANDRLVLNLLAGADVAEASGLAAGVIALTVDGGQGDDVLIGSAGPDTLFGGEGDDILLGGPGFDVLDGGPGDNVVIQN